MLPPVRLTWKQFLSNLQSESLRQSNDYAESTSLAASILFWFTILQCLYCGLNYTIDDMHNSQTIFSSIDPIWFKWLLVFGGFQAISNWICTRLYESFHKNPCGKQNNTASNSTSINVGEDFKALEWRYCNTCQNPCPARAHHCKVCKKCVLKRDHHCFMLGTCIGYYNQRFFIILSFYSGVFGAFCLYSSTLYLRRHYHPWWPELFLPVAIFKLLFGDLKLHMFLMVCQWYIISWACPVTLGFFFLQMYICFTGTTVHEHTKKSKVLVLSSVCENFRSVFGSFWLINFLFPAIVLKQPGNGTEWPGVYKRVEKTLTKKQDLGLGEYWNDSFYV